MAWLPSKSPKNVPGLRARTLHSGITVIWSYGNQKNDLQRTRAVGSRDRSRFVSEALAARLQERDAALIRACEIANQDPDVTEIEKEFDGIGDEMAEPWR
jgi:hypothetical protein